LGGDSPEIWACNVSGKKVTNAYIDTLFSGKMGKIWAEYSQWLKCEVPQKSKVSRLESYPTFVNDQTKTNYAVVSSKDVSSLSYSEFIKDRSLQSSEVLESWDRDRMASDAFVGLFNSSVKFSITIGGTQDAFDITSSFVKLFNPNADYSVSENFNTWIDNSLVGAQNMVNIATNGTSDIIRYVSLVVNVFNSGKSEYAEKKYKMPLKL